MRDSFKHYSAYINTQSVFYSSTFQFQAPEIGYIVNSQCLLSTSIRRRSVAKGTLLVIEAKSMQEVASTVAARSTTELPNSLVCP
jgi:hypothetical protein